MQVRHDASAVAWLLPDRHIHNFRVSRSGDRQILHSLGTSPRRIAKLQNSGRVGRVVYSEKILLETVFPENNKILFYSWRNHLLPRSVLGPV